MSEEEFDCYGVPIKQLQEYAQKYNTEMASKFEDYSQNQICDAINKIISKYDGSDEAFDIYRKKISNDLVTYLNNASSSRNIRGDVDAVRSLGADIQLASISLTDNGRAILDQAYNRFKIPKSQNANY